MPESGRGGKLNGVSFFRRGGELTDLRERECRTQVGRNPVDGSWYIDLNGVSGHVRAVLRPEQAFAMAKGILMAMAQFNPELVGEVRSLLQALVPHA